MFYALLDLLACPVCRSPLTLLDAEEQPQATLMRMSPARRTSPPGALVGPLPVAPGQSELARLLAPHAAQPAPGRRDLEVSVVEGVLACGGCERWFPIRDSLPELLPDHLRDWDADRRWLAARQARVSAHYLAAVWERLSAAHMPRAGGATDQGAHYKLAEMAVTQRNLPLGFFAPGEVMPFLPANPGYSLDLIARFVTTVSQLGCGTNGMVLDLGVGYAWTTEWLVRLGYQVIGFDLTKAYLLAGYGRLGANLPHLMVADAEHLPLAKNIAEAVLSFDAFHHLPDRPRTMQELSRVMRAGARLVLVEPGKAHETHPHSVEVMREHGILERGFDRADLEEYVRGTGLGSIAHHRSTAHPHDIFVVQKAGRLEPDSAAPHTLLAELKVQLHNPTLAEGEAPRLTASLTNTGDTTWLNATPTGQGEVHLGAKLYDVDHHLLLENYARVILPRVLRPGERTQFQFELPAIPRPGDCLIELDMVNHGFMWFKDSGAPPVHVAVSVAGALATLAEPAAAPRIQPVELAFEARPLQIAPARVGGQRIPLSSLLGVAWQVLRAEGPLTLLRKGLAYLSGN